MQALIELLQILKAYRWTLPILFVLGILASLAEGIGIGLLIPFAEAVFGQATFGSSENALIKALSGLVAFFQAGNEIALIVGLIVSLIVAKAVIQFAYAVMSGWVSGRVLHQLRCVLFDRLLRMDFRRFSARPSGEFYNIVAGETWRATEAIDTSLVLLKHAATTIVFSAMLLILSWQLTLIGAAVVVLSSLLVGFISARAERLGDLAVEANSRLSDRMLSILTGMRTVRTFVQEPREQGAMTAASEDIRKTFLHMEILAGVTQPLLEAIYLPFFIAVVLLSGVFDVGLPTLMAFLVLMYRLVPYVKAIEQGRVELAGSLGGVSAVVALARLPDGTEEAKRLPFAGLDETITFDHVSFAYDSALDEANAVDDVSFVVRKGTTVAIVGASGSGKSTLMSLLLGLYTPTSGDIRIDERSLFELDLSSWRRRVGFAGQDCHLFPGTVAENVAYGCPDASRAAILAATARADAVDFLGALPHGIDTRITREGANLSGGQRQRIALARALLIEPDVLILDEATNAVDNVTEATLQTMLRALSGQTTIFIIAHRMSTIRHADWIVALDRGRVAEQGAPRDLLRKNAAFAKLYRLEVEALQAGDMPAPGNK